MKATSYLPAEALRPFIQHFLIIESEGKELINRILPGTSLVLAFRLKGQINYLQQENKDPLPSLVLSGLRKSVRLINYEKESGTLLVIFKEAGASAFFREPLYELFEDSVALDNFIKPSAISVLTEQLFEAENDKSKIAVMEYFLLSRLSNVAPDPLILSALRNIHASMGIGKIKDLADLHCLSQDAFEKRFRKKVGATPKYFSSIVRMKNIIRQAPQSISYTALALEAGFTDQSHFNKEFKLFTGLTPTDFFKAPVFW